MIPYIVILVFILVMTLFLVYRQVDGFRLQGLTVTDTTTVQEALDYANRYLQENKKLKDTLEKLEEFDEELSEDDARNLGLPASGVTKPLSEAMKRQIETDITVLESMLSEFQKKIDSGEIQATVTLKEALLTINPTMEGDSFNGEQFNTFIKNQVRAVNARKAFLKKKSLPKQNADVLSIFDDTKKALRASNIDESEEVTEDKDVAPELSPMQTEELENRISKRVAKQLKDTVLAKRNSEPMPCPYAPYSSDGIQQGQEYTQGKPTVQPDMSEYIRKDSIPCWNCSLP